MLLQSLSTSEIEPRAILTGMLISHAVYCVIASGLAYSICSIVAHRLLPLSFFTVLFSIGLLIPGVVTFVMYAILDVDSPVVLLSTYFGLLFLCVTYTAITNFNRIRRKGQQP